MFGNKNKMKPEEIQNMKDKLEKREDFFNRVAGIRGKCEANISEIDSSKKQSNEYLNQVARNVENAIAQSKESIEKQAALAGDIRQIEENIVQTNEEYAQVVANLKVEAGSLMKLVDDNKHYTTPSKLIKEFPEKLDLKMVKCIDYAAQMSEFRKQMGVLALNAAIEAGRMGDSGKNFVDAAEEIRAYTSNFAGVVGSLQQELEDVKGENEVLKAQVDKLVMLLKDSNVATANLMKKCNENIAIAEKISLSDRADEVSVLKDKVIDIRNTQEEILKEEERNKMQISDIYSEFELQQDNENELYSCLLPILDETK